MSSRLRGRHASREGRAAMVLYFLLIAGAYVLLQVRLSGTSTAQTLSEEKSYDDGEAIDVTGVSGDAPELALLPIETCTIWGTTGADVISATPDSDIICPSGGVDTIVGATSDDILVFANLAAPVSADLSLNTVIGATTNVTFSGITTVYGTEFADTFVAGSSPAELYGLGGNDSITGGSDADILSGGAGADVISGGAGDDTIAGIVGNDALTLGLGVDMVDLSDSSSGAAVNLSAGTLNISGFATSTVTGAEIIIGTEFADTLVGSDAAEILEGGAGGDSIAGGGGNDEVIGGEGIDTLQGGLGNDLLSVAEFDGVDSASDVGGVDTVSFSEASVGVTVNLALGQVTPSGAATVALSGFESVEGSSFADSLTGSEAPNTILGGEGNDTIAAAGGNDVLQGGGGVDSVSGAAGDDSLSSCVADVMYLPINPDAIAFDVETEGYAVESLPPESLSGGDGADSFCARDDDTVIGGAGLNTLDLSGRLTGARVNLALGTLDGIATSAVSGITKIIGSAFGDILYGSAGADTILGGAGNDRIQGLAGNDILDGGTGIDLVSYASASGSGTTGVTVTLGSTASQNTVLAGYDTLTGFENLYGSPLADNLVGNSGANEIGGGAGNDRLTGTAGDDALTGGEGNDYLNPGIGNDVVQGSGGEDTLSYENVSSGVRVDLDLAYIAQDTLGGGIDTIGGVEGLIGSPYADTLFARTVDAGTYISALGGADVVYGRFGVDTLLGGAGNDRIRAEEGADTISGGDGDDKIDGGTGTDSCYGGAGTDSSYRCEDLSSIEKILLAW